MLVPSINQSLSGATGCVVTAHARVRMQQRGIPAQTLDLVLRYGKRAYDHDGGVIFYLDKRSRRRLLQESEPSFRRQVEKGLNAYVVLDENGQVLTVGHRYRRLNRG